jgi:hypothetical protein
MTHRDSIEAVMQALQRQQSEAYEREPISAEPIIEVARAFLPRRPTQNARIEGPGFVLFGPPFRFERRVLPILRPVQPVVRSPPEDAA